MLRARFLPPAWLGRTYGKPQCAPHCGGSTNRQWASAGASESTTSRGHISRAYQPQRNPCPPACTGYLCKGGGLWSVVNRFVLRTARVGPSFYREIGQCFPSRFSENPSIPVTVTVSTTHEQPFLSFFFITATSSEISSEYTESCLHSHDLV